MLVSPDASGNDVPVGPVHGYAQEVTEWYTSIALSRFVNLTCWPDRAVGIPVMLIIERSPGAYRNEPMSTRFVGRPRRAERPPSGPPKLSFSCRCPCVGVPLSQSAGGDASKPPDAQFD